MGRIYFTLDWACKGPSLEAGCTPKDSITAKAKGTSNNFTYAPSGQKPIIVSGPFVADDGTVMFYIKN